MRRLGVALLPFWLVACGSPAPASSLSATSSGGSSTVSANNSTESEPSTALRPSVASGGTNAGVGIGSADDSEGRTGANVSLVAGGGAPGSSTGSGDVEESAGGSGAGSGDAKRCPATATATPGEVNESLTLAGVTRTFIRHVPPGYTGTVPVPVVIDFHPRGGTASSWKGSTNWASVADSRGFIVIWPDGIQNSWNVGERCCGPAHDQNVDDVGFTRALLATLEREACIDSKRIYATGCSNGGGMAYDLACSAAELIAAVAPVDFDCTTGPTNNPSCGNCSPGRPISQTQFRGTNDQVVPYAGGVSGVNSAITFPGGPANFETWGQLNSCTGTPEALAGHPACQTYPSCGAGVDNTLCTVPNGTHCGSYDSFDIVEVAWEQLSKASLP